MAKPITIFAKYIAHPTIQAIIIVLLIIPVLTLAFPAYSQDLSLTELQTKALMLNKQGQYSEAVTVAEEALKITEEKFGSDHPKTAASMNILGLL
jgi:Tfp pilus assembly protein PilE